jgi:hypothetical protein
MIEVPYNELETGTNYYISKGASQHNNKQFGKFMRTDNKPNGDAWVYFNHVEPVGKTKKSIIKHTLYAPTNCICITQYRRINQTRMAFLQGKYATSTK